MIVLRNKSFAEREKVPDDIMEKVERTGVIQQDREGRWRIINKKKREFWSQVYPSKERSKAALAAFHANRH